MIRNFDEWTERLVERGPMSNLSGGVVGIEATEYLNRIHKLPVPNVDRPIKEALLTALGGTPFGLKFVIKTTLQVWKDNGITPFFVFSGLDVGKRDAPFAASEVAASINAKAWQLYDNHQAEAAVEAFSNSGSVTPQDLFRYLQQILKEDGVDFMVAPYGSWPQLAYLYTTNAVDAVAGSSEILLYNVPEIVTSWDFKAFEFSWVKRKACIRDLGQVSSSQVTSDMFIDACLLAGTSLLPTIPPLDNQGASNKPKIKAAMELIMSTGRSGHSVALHYQNDPQCRALNYLDRFRRVRLSIIHHVVLTSRGAVEPFEADHAPSDIHEFIGQRLPEELYFYLSKGIIGPRVLNWRTSGEILEFPPLDNGDSDEYKTLVRDQLKDMRYSTISLLSFSVHRYYLHRDVEIRCWFDKDKPDVISMASLDDPRPTMSKWCVHEDLLASGLNNYYRTSGLLGQAVKSLNDPSFAAKTVKEKDVNNPLKLKHEILLNSIWRLLHLRGYINDDHTLTAWGKVLHATVSAVPSPNLEEAAIIAIELARLGLLTAKNMFTSYSGAPYRGSETVKRNTLLIARIACLGKFQHQEIGYTGPLSRHLLAYHSMITAVQRSLRDLAEVCLTTLLLNGDADRHRDDYTDLGIDLPFLVDNDCALGLAVNAYLDEIASHPNPPSPETKKNVKVRGAQELFIYSKDYAGDIDRAFYLWDAVYKGIQVAGDMFPERQVFDEANTWLAGLR